MSVEIVLDDKRLYDQEIEAVVRIAFKQDNEAELVKNIKQQSEFYVSYVALDKDKVVGHVMISPMALNGEMNVLCLAPVSVLDEYANQGIGSRLIKAAISEAIKNEKYKLITVLGSDHYYSRFGFESYNVNKFKIPFDIEARFFQLLELEPDCLRELSGEFTYPNYFGV